MITPSDSSLKQQGGQGREMTDKEAINTLLAILDRQKSLRNEETGLTGDDEQLNYAIQRIKRCAELEAELRVAVDLLDSIKDRHVHSYGDSISINALYAVDEDLEKARALLNGPLAIPEEDT